jgi:hypothetical protein
VTPENDAPTLTLVNTLMSAQEDTPYIITHVDLLAASDANDPDGDALVFRVFSVTTGTLTKNGVLVVPGFTMLATGESLVWTPPADENNVTEGGPHDAFTVTVNDTVLNSSPAVNVPINVIACNDPPSFLRGSDIVAANDGTAYIQFPWATSIVAGPADELGAPENQTIMMFNVSTDNDALFTTGGGSLPTVANNGQLDFEIGTGQTGFARVTVSATDTGANGGCDISASTNQTFVISSPVRFRRCGAIYITSSGPSAIVVGDFKGNDGKRDLFVVNMTGNTLQAWQGTGSTRFTVSETLPLPAGSMPASLAMNDYNRDGRDDLAVANFGNDDVIIFKGREDGLTQLGTISVGTGPMHMASGDLTGDGRADLITANFGSANISVLVNLGNATFAAAVNTAVGNGPSAVSVGFFDADANLDVAVANHDDDTVTFLLGDGAGGFASSSVVGVGDMPIALSSAVDFDGDGDVDVAVANFNDDTVQWLEGDGLGGFTAPVMNIVTVGDGPRALAHRDVDFDGDLDLVVANNLDASVSIIVAGVGAPTVEHWPVGNNPVAIATGNFNGPNNGAEIVVGNFMDDSFQVLCNVFPQALPFPNSTDRSLDVLEDSSVAFSAQGTVLVGGALTYAVATAPVNGGLTPLLNPLPNATYTPDPDFFGTDTFTFTVATSLLTSSEATLTIRVQAVNDEPTMTIGTPSSSAASGAGPQVVPAFATAISKGPANEAAQKIQIQTSPHQTWNKDLFVIGPNIDVTGTLRYTPRAGQSGATSIKFRIVDNGGSNFGGDPVGNEVTVTFTVNP